MTADVDTPPLHIDTQTPAYVAIGLIVACVGIMATFTGLGLIVAMVLL